MTAENPEQNDQRLLILVSESADLPAQVRSPSRTVCRWMPDDDESADTFSGDPADSSTYDWTQGARSVTAIVDVRPADRARRIVQALRSAREDAAVLVLSAQAADVDGDHDGTLARGGRLREVVRLDLEEELQRLEAERRAYCLREFAAGEGIVPILIHAEPDPDAVSSALAVATLLGGSPERTPIVTLSEITRPENRRMVDLLRIRVTRVTEAELRSCERIITVDTQPRGLQQEGRPRVAVIDHHPAESSYEADFCDIRPEYGATATMLTEYLRAGDDGHISPMLATALLFGIKTDTDSLMRGVTPADVAAYAFLQERADLQLVRRFERPTYSAGAARAFGRALADADCEEDLCVTWLGELDGDESHVLADLADFCLTIENITWVAVAARLGDEVVITLRHAGNAGSGPGAGDLAKMLAAAGGSGGGHATMARVALPADDARLGVGTGNGADPRPLLRRLIRDGLEELSSSRRASRPVHPA